LKDFWQKRGWSVMGNDSKKGGENSPDNSAGNAASDPSQDANLMDSEYASADAEVGKLAKDLEDLRQTLLRRQADFDNYRKRVEKERSEDSRRSTARVIEALIPVVDSFDQALASHREPEYANYRKGFELIHKQLIDNIAKLGAERIDPIGMTFDPHLHQAMDRTETAEKDEGTILQVFQPGYVFHGRVLRPAMVRVAVHPSAASKTAN
jgi:molecular chaperone GrpE